MGRNQLKMYETKDDNFVTMYSALEQSLTATFTFLKPIVHKKFGGKIIKI